MNNSFTKWWMVSQCQFMERKNTLIRDANILFPDIYWIQVYNFCCDFNQSINRLMSIYGENNSLKGDTNILVKVIYWIRLLMWFKQSINKLHLTKQIVQSGLQSTNLFSVIWYWKKEEQSPRQFFPCSFHYDYDFLSVLQA